MAEAKVHDGVAIVAYVNGKAVDSEGRPIPGAPREPKSTPPEQQPGAVAGAISPEERMGVAIANALLVASGKKPVASTAATSTAVDREDEDDEDEEEELPTLADLGGHLAKMKTVEEVEALQARDERKGAVSLYEARLEELKAK